jgi:ferritin-like metal-binding protein YciE
METEHHEQLIRDRLEARGVAPARLKHAAFKADTPAGLVSHALAYEHLELAGYELLRRLARLAGDHTTIVVAAAIREDERAMAERLEACFDRTVEASLRVADRANLDEQLNKDLAVELAPQPDTPAKLAAFAYAFEFLQVGGYEQLARVARRAADGETERLSREIIATERDMADRVWQRLDAALEASLGVAPEATVA